MKSNRSKEPAAGIVAGSHSHQLLLRALKKKAKIERKSLVPILNKISEPGTASQLNKLYSNHKLQAPKKLTPETALALISSCGLSQDDYQTIRNVAKSHNANIFPSYHQVLQAKKECLPKNIIVGESYADQPLQDLLDHTASRFLNIDKIKDSISGIIEPDPQTNELVIDLSLRCKWGLDGSTGQAQYKQALNSASDDKTLFSIMLVRLDLSHNKVIEYSKLFKIIAF